MRSTQATGFQLLFLFFAAIFGAMLITRWVSRTFSLPTEYFTPLSQVVTAVVAGLILMAAKPLRRGAAKYLASPIPRSRWRELGMVTALKLTLPFGIAGALAIFGILAGDDQVAIRTFVASDPAKQWALALAPSMLVFTVLISWFIGPLLEEIYFRGFLYGAWERQWGWIPATLLTSIAFGLVHPGHVVSSLLGSVIYIAILRRTGSLWACICAHCAFNTLVSWPLLGHLLFANRPGDPLSPRTWSIEIACFVVIAISLPLYLFLARKPYEAQPVQS